MAIWDRCALCDAPIYLGEMCYGLSDGGTICADCCTGPENTDGDAGWQSVKAGLPDDLAPVLTVCAGKVCTDLVCLDGVWMRREGGKYVYDTRTGAVTHWMPLPEPPKEGMNDESD